MSRETHDAGFLLGETLELARANFGLAAAAVAAMTGVGVAADLLGRNGAAINLIFFPVSLLLQYELTLAALAHRGLVQRRGRRRLWALLGLGILSGLGILAGLVLLVLPGLYLYVRWSLGAPILIAEEAGPAEALSRSGAEVSGRFWPVAGLFLLVASPWLVGLGSAAVAGDEVTPLSSLALNLPIDLSLVAGWLAAVAVYADGRGGESLADVFA
jgi:hypothetical protein